MLSLCKLAGRSTRSSTQMLQSTSQSFLRSAQRGGRPCLLKRKENLKIWQRRTRPIMKEKWKLIFLLKGGRGKKIKDPNALNRPPSAFFLFCSEYRPKIKGEHPGLSIGDIAKKLGEMWNNTVQMTSSLMKRKLLSWRRNTKRILLQRKKMKRIRRRKSKEINPKQGGNLSLSEDTSLIQSAPP